MSSPPPPLSSPPPSAPNKDEQQNNAKTAEGNIASNEPKQATKANNVSVPKKELHETTLGSNTSSSSISDLPSTEVKSLLLEKSSMLPVKSDVFAWRDPNKQPQTYTQMILEKSNIANLSPSALKDLPSDPEVASIRVDQMDITPSKSIKPTVPSPHKTKAKFSNHQASPALKITSPVQSKKPEKPSSQSPQIRKSKGAGKTNAVIKQKKPVNKLENSTQIQPTKKSCSPVPTIIPNKQPNIEVNGTQRSRTTSQKPTTASKPKVTTSKDPKTIGAATKPTTKAKPVSVKTTPVKKTPAGRVTNTDRANAKTRKKNVTTSKAFEPPPKE